MARLSTFQLLALNDEVAFEEMCRDLYSKIWNDPNTQLNGRKGHTQKGVDFWGNEGNALIGVQCKKRQYYEGDLTESAVKAIVDDAKKFIPPLKRLLIASITRRNVTLQECARVISDCNKKCGLFDVSLKSWDDLVLELGDHLDIVNKYYSDFFIEPIKPEVLVGTHDLEIREENVGAAVNKAIKAGKIESAYGGPFANDVRRLFVEVLMNGVDRKEATSAFLAIKKDFMILSYDGNPFDPRDLIHSGKEDGGATGEVIHFVTNHLGTFFLGHAYEDGLNNFWVQRVTEASQITDFTPCSITFVPKMNYEKESLEELGLDPKCDNIFVLLSSDNCFWTNIKRQLTPLIERIGEQKLILLMPKDNGHIEQLIKERFPMLRIKIVDAPI